MDINLIIPRDYTEMTDKQIRYVAALNIYGMSEKDIWRRCFIKFTGVKPIIGYADKYILAKKGLKGFFSWSIHEMNYFIKKMSWITSDFSGIRPLKINGLHPCDELMRDAKLLQYINAENHYQAYIFTKDKNELLMLTATLYQSGTNYSQKKTQKIARKIRNKEIEQFTCLCWMHGIKKEFSTKWPYLFQKDKKNEFENPDFEIVPPNMELIIRNQIRMLSKGDVTKETQVLASLTHSALDELNQQCFEYEKLKSNPNH